jgi:hypothetical protein
MACNGSSIFPFGGGILSIMAAKKYFQLKPVLPDA